MCLLQQFLQSSFLKIIISHMLCEICQHSPPKLHHHYNIEYVKQRFIPTYSHTNIFEDGAHKHGRCQSASLNALKGQVNHSFAKEQVRYLNDKPANTWYDNSKKELLQSLCFTERYPRDRKLADLSSDPIFGGTFMHISKQAVPKSNTQREKPTQDCKKQTKQKLVQQQAKSIQKSFLKPNLQKKDEKMTEEPLTSKFTTAKKTMKPQIHPQKNYKQSVVQKYTIKDEVASIKNSLGKKLQKNIVLGASPAFSLIKKAIL